MVDVALEDVGAQGWTLFEDLTPPVMVLREPALAHNIELMRGYIDANGVAIAPHGKTTMAPAIWRRQLDAGAWGITAATPGQVRVMRDVGVPRILLANELVDDAAIAWVARQLGDPSFRFACWLDSIDGVDLLAARLRDAGAGRPLAVLVELGHAGGRTGARSLVEALEVVGAVADRSELALAGIAGYEGTLADDRSDANVTRVDAFLEELSTLAERAIAFEDVGAAGLDDAFVVTAGGSAFFDRVTDVLRGGVAARDDVRVVLRSGCYVTHDHGHYERVSPMPSSRGAGGFLPAIEVWGSVLSTPEPGVAVIGVGKRDVAADIDPPIARWISAATTVDPCCVRDPSHAADRPARNSVPSKAKRPQSAGSSGSASPVRRGIRSPALIPVIEAGRPRDRRGRDSLLTIRHDAAVGRRDVREVPHRPCCCRAARRSCRERLRDLRHPAAARRGRRR